MTMSAATRVWRASRILSRQLHASHRFQATSELLMPAMSPTMTEGTINEWKVKVGDSYSAGDVLLSLETDKASIDVEAQDDGIMGKILIENGAQGVKVGELIALLAEEGDDISSIEAPTKSTTASEPSAGGKKDKDAPSEQQSAPSPVSAGESKPQADPAPPTSSKAYQPPSSVQNGHGHAQPTHSNPLLPSVLRMLVLNNIQDASKIKGTGYKGQLSKGDVLAFLGKVDNPQGTYKAQKDPIEAQKQLAKQPDQLKKEPATQPMDGLTFRQLITAGLSAQAKPKPVVKQVPYKNVSTFDSILDQYLPPHQRSTATRATPPAPTMSSSGVAPKKKNSIDAFLDL